MLVPLLTLGKFCPALRFYSPYLPTHWKFARRSPMKKLVWLLSLTLITTLGIACALTPSNWAQPKATSPNISTWNLNQLLRDSWGFYKGRFLVDGAHVVSNTY